MSDTRGADPAAVRTDLAVVRTVLDHIEAGMSVPTAASAEGVAWRTAYRWQDIAERHPGWPTADDIAAQAQHLAEHWERLRRRRLAEVSYRRRVAFQQGPMRIPATGTARRIRALMAIGWTQIDIGSRLGVSGQRISHLALERYDTVYRGTAAAVADLYDEICMTVPRDADRRPRAGRVHERQRVRARQLGWAPPLAWDDIDNPDERPATGKRAERGVDEVVVVRILTGDWRLRATVAEKVEVLRRWRTTGGSDNELERLTGWNISRDLSPHLPSAERAA